ncbi:uncharacterized protein SAPINGB_P006016 [Magnusiomyces paraingens]|uniref:Cell division control protein 73 C-terminal domain-containing protein n=1 Tax=Magnusiomyces paraingens TaxID=2606893 RepID=A0A5E8C802_9ASCO|nr:uncharacterized protein SAPINGB_P006016 [Saprochaete ingens]VVT58058.1 unnamed protein product [Saprochaete ingens]
MTIDPLVALRNAIQSNAKIELLSSEEYLPSSILPDSELATAKYLHFPANNNIQQPQQTIPLTTVTRYAANNQTIPIDLRTVYHAWLARELKVTDYITLSNERGIMNLKTTDRTDLLTWLKDPRATSANVKDSTNGSGAATTSSGASETSESAKETNGSTSSASAKQSKENGDARSETRVSGSSSSTTSASGSTPVNNPLDIVTLIESEIPRISPPEDYGVQQIYDVERSLVNRNSVLHGTKQIDFSLIAKECRDQIINVVRNSQRSSHHGQSASRHGASGRNGYPQGQYSRSGDPALAPRGGSGLIKGPGSSSSHTNSGSGSSNGSRGNKDPIILLSPSTSALLNMGNVKAFLERGEFVPSTSSIGASNLQYITRYSTRLAGISGGNGNSSSGKGGSAGSGSAGGHGVKVKFLVVDNVERFRPEYWDRVVAVFVTGQSWQFKTYKWSNPNDLFQKVAGVYLTYVGERVPPVLGSWTNITVATIPKNERFRDREAAELIWNQIEKWMLSKGWRF